MACTAQEFDDLLDKMEAALPAIVEDADAEYSVKRMIAKHDLLEPFSETSNFMRSALIDAEDIQQDRVKLIALFGGDCARISRLRCICEDAEREVSCSRPNERRVLQCLAACDSVERVLEDCGFSAQLRAAKTQQHNELEERRRSSALHQGMDQQSREELLAFEAALPRGSVASVESGLTDCSDVGEPPSIEVSRAQEASRTETTSHSDDLAGRHPLDPLTKVNLPNPNDNAARNRLDPLASSGGYAVSQGSALLSPLGADPLRRLAEEQKLADNPLTGGKKAERLEAFLGEKITPVPTGLSPRPNASSPRPNTSSPRPKENAERTEKALPKVEIISSEDKHGVTWYKMSVTEYGMARYIWKRYSDFCKLDESLTRERELRIGAGKEFQLVLGDIPDPGLFGFRHALGIGSFERQRQEALQEYISNLVRQVRSISEYPAINDFITKEKDHPLLRTDYQT
mmetsp:Transcript_89697/g.141638  ORF Transcript_89697/g.141638 Transcript_89697/m.141638 type:complete len:459 (+) Transcript_89697:47-1423(+)